VDGDRRKIIHVDMDAFYASVEQRDDPRLRGRPVVVGGPPRSRGVVCAASYEARAFGVRSAMPSAQAVRLCPEAVFLPPDFIRYRAVSRAVHAIFARYTDQVEPLSLDEAYLDVTRNKPNLPFATVIAREIRDAIRGETGLTASAGVAPNKFLAKVASDANKPDGLCVVTPERVASFLERLPVRRVPGIGPVAEERLRRLGVTLVPDLLKLTDRELARHFGRHGLVLRDLARGVDSRPVAADAVRKSVGIEDTFARDVVRAEDALVHLERLSHALERRLAEAGARGRTITLKVKYHDFRVVSRSRTFPFRVAEAAVLYETGRELLAGTAAGTIAVRLLGLSVSNLDLDQREPWLPFIEIVPDRSRRASAGLLPDPPVVVTST
jgi:DNA polymerase-4